VTARSLNVRGGPGIDHPVVSGLVAGDEVEVVGRNADGSWLQIVCVSAGDDGTAWIASAFTDLDLVGVMELPEIDVRAGG